MTVQLKNIIKYGITLAIAGTLFWLAFRNMPIGTMINDIKQADFSWIFVTVIIGITSHVLRALRWNMLLQPIGYSPKPASTFMAIMIGYFANIFVPRMGEVSRCAVLNKIENVHFNAAFGTVVAERIVDLLSLMTIIGLSFVLEHQRFSDFFFNHLLKHDGKSSILTNPLVYIAIGPLLLIGIIWLFFKKQILASKLYAKVKTFVLGLVEGVLSIRKLRNRSLFILYTFLMWICYYLMTYLMFFSLPFTSGLDPLAGLVILVVASLGMSAPVQGGIGAFHLLVSAALTLFYGLSDYQGKTYATVVHTSQFLTMFVVGGVCSIVVLFYKRKASPVPQNV